MPKRDVVSASIPNQLAYLPLALTLTRESARHFGFGGSALSQIEIAAEEAITNIMKHAYDAEENLTFDLVCERIPCGIRITLHEMGIPFDPSRIHQYDPERDLAEGSAAGLGTFLMKTMMDECSFRNLGPEGKETVLVKLLPEASGPAGMAAPEAAAGAEPEPLPRIEYDVRLMRDEEAIEVSKCAYNSHGYSFFDEHIYYPERLVELNRKGEMISAVAVTKDGKFMGHAALLYQHPEDPIAELTFVFVNVEYRGQGALGRLNDVLFSAPSEGKLLGLYAYAVANHVFTQKALIRSGMHETGILLATSPQSWKFKGIPGDASQRISVVLAFKYMRPPEKLTLYVPERHRDIIVRTYGLLGAEHDYRVSAAAPEMPGNCRLETSVNETESCAEIYVRGYGQDLVREVRKELRGFCLKQIAAINLFLDLADPAAGFATAEMEKLGFFFAGILPRTRMGDALILQYLNNVDLDYSKIAAYSEEAKAMLAYIRSCDPNVLV